METSSYNVKCVNRKWKHETICLVGPYFLLDKACQWDTSKTKKNGLLKQIFSQQKEPIVKERYAPMSYQEGTAWW